VKATRKGNLRPLMATDRAIWGQLKAIDKAIEGIYDSRASQRKRYAGSLLGFPCHDVP
jgi:hypothetical protein